MHTQNESLLTRSFRRQRVLVFLVSTSHMGPAQEVHVIQSIMNVRREGNKCRTHDAFV